MSNKSEKFMREMISLSLDMCPFVGNIKGAIKLMMKRDIITLKDQYNMDKLLTGSSFSCQEEQKYWENWPKMQIKR